MKGEGGRGKGEDGGRKEEEDEEEMAERSEKIKDGGEKRGSSAGGLILFLPSFVFFGYSRVKGEGGNGRKKRKN